MTNEQWRNGGIKIERCKERKKVVVSDDADNNTSHIGNSNDKGDSKDRAGLWKAGISLGLLNHQEVK